jgi:adenine phosphoribosyltransferase
MNQSLDLNSLIREVPEFPIPGVLFRDISPLLANAEAFHLACIKLIENVDLNNIDIFAGIESRGFIFASYLAGLKKKGFLPIRKAGKLPPPVESESYKLEYGTATLEVAHGQQRIMILDDVLATGGTLEASIRLCNKAGYQVQAVAVLINLTSLNKMKFNGSPIHSVLKY